LQQYPLIEDTFRLFIASPHAMTGARVKSKMRLVPVGRRIVRVKKGIYMKNTVLAGLAALGLTIAVQTIPAEARCADTDSCRIMSKAAPAKVQRGKARVASAGVFHRRSHVASAALRLPPVSRQSEGAVAAMIKDAAPRYGVPTWFALRIARVESGFNPRARGTHGELGVFQMKCQTAHSIGYRGSCAGLLDARTGVDVGLRHLSLALKASGGDLRLAASKHNGGLGRKSLVPRYVAEVF